MNSMMRLFGLLALVDVLQVHLWLAVALGVVLARRWHRTWAAVGVATAFYCAATSALSFVGYTPSSYVVVLLGAFVSGWSEDTSRLRVYSTGIATLFLLFCALPTGTAFFRRRSP